eukprot:2940848-Pyramimonas_sp.AAC.1
MKQRFHCTLLPMPFEFRNLRVADVLPVLAQEQVALIGVLREFSPALDNEVRPYWVLGFRVLPFRV